MWRACAQLRQRSSTKPTNRPPCRIDSRGVSDTLEIINYCSGDNYTGYGNNGSVKRCYCDNSNGLLTCTNDGTIYISVPQLKTYFSDTSRDCRLHVRLLINDALAIWVPVATNTADATGFWDFSDFEATNHVNRFYRLQAPWLRCRYDNKRFEK